MSLPASATPPTLYAAASAVGTGDCSTSADACTLSTALSDVVAGGTIELVTPGTTVYSAAGGFTVGTAGTSATSPVTIEPAPGVTNPTLDGGKSSTVLTMSASMYLDISGVTIENGSTVASCGGIDNSSGGALTVTDSTLSGNNADYFGGAICNEGGTTNVDDSTLTNNGTPQAGGAIFNENGTTNVTDSTLSGNHAGFFGGGIYNAGGTVGTVNVTGSTLSGNYADNSGGGIDNAGTVNVGATIVANSTSGDDCGFDGGTFNDEGYNIDDDGSCGFGGTAESNSSNLDASLGALQNNGGPTQTILPNAASPSPAVGVIPPSTTLPVVGQVCPTTDQRGLASAPGVNCDIGAVQTASILYASAPNALLLGDCADPADTCTLPTALSEVNAGGIIELVTPGTSSVYSGGFNVATLGTSTGSPVTIEPYAGVTNPTLDGGKTQTVLNVYGGRYLDISGLTIQNGSAIQGAGISNEGTLSVTDSTLSGNSSNGGGGIWNGGTTTVTDSTLSGNSSTFLGGGIWNSGTLSVTDSTLSDNIAASQGGGIYNDSGTVSVTITDSTVAGNSASQGGGIYNDGGTVNVGATIVANSEGPLGGDCSGTITDEGYNIDSDGTCNFTGTGSISDSATLDASLGALQNNGGTTDTILPTSTSPAADVIPTGTTLSGVSVCPRTDQTGTAGPVSPQTDCTIGAVEARTVFYASAPSALGFGNCLTPTNACLLTTALGEVGPGGTIELVTPGSSALYSGGFTVATSGTSAADPVTIEPYAGVSNPTLDGGKTQTVLTDEENDQFEYAFNPHSGVYLDISGVTIQNGLANADYDDGGGIFNDGGTVTVSDSTLSDNSAPGGGGGGIFAYGGTTSVIDSTLSGNSANNIGGGILNDSGSINGSGTTSVIDSTLSGNSANNVGGGIFNAEGTVTLGATILANSTGGDCAYNTGTFTDDGYNVDDDGSCGFSATNNSISDSTTLDASLGALRNNGGTTDTIAPSSSSPAAGVIPDPTTVNSVSVCGTGATDRAAIPGPLPGAPSAPSAPWRWPPGPICRWR